MSSGAEPTTWLSGIGIVITAVSGLLAVVTRKTKEEREQDAKIDKRLTRTEDTIEDIKGDIKDIQSRLWNRRD